MLKNWNFRAMLIACGTSAALTVALFWSFAGGALAIAFAAIALVVEWTRFAALDRAVIKMHKPIERWNLGLWLLLTMVSVLASIATINKGAIIADQAAPERVLLLAQIDNLQTTIDQNHNFIRRYGELDRIRQDALPIQEKNLTLIDQITSIQNRLTGYPQPEPNELQALAVGVTVITGGEPDQVLWWLVMGFSLALEIVAAWLVWVHALEQRENPVPITIKSAAPIIHEKPVEPVEPQNALYNEIRKLVVEDRAIPPVQRRIAAELKVGASRVKEILVQLEEEGTLLKNEKGGFEIT